MRNVNLFAFKLPELRLVLILVLVVLLPVGVDNRLEVLRLGTYPGTTIVVDRQRHCILIIIIIIIIICIVFLKFLGIVAIPFSLHPPRFSLCISAS